MVIGCLYSNADNWTDAGGELMYYNLIDSIFKPVTSFLDLILDKLMTIGTIAAKGIRLSDYFGFFSVLGPSWVSLINSALSALVFVFILYMVSKYSNVLLWFKDLIKWW